MKVVINVCHGGFGLSKEAYDYLGIKWDDYGYKYSGDTKKERTNPKLIKMLEAIGVEKASGGLAKLKIVEIPDDVKWHIEEYDGTEWVAEDHRTWG